MVELFDQVGHLSWCSPREFSPGFTCDFVLASFLNSPGNAFNLRQGDEGSLAYLAYTNPSWLPVPSSNGPRYTYYSIHWMRRQFGFNQDIPRGVQGGNAFSPFPGSVSKVLGFFLLVTEEPSICDAELPTGSLCFQWLC